MTIGLDVISERLQVMIFQLYSSVNTEHAQLLFTFGLIINHVIFDAYERIHKLALNDK